jgi:hypothetical protein
MSQFDERAEGRAGCEWSDAKMNALGEMLVRVL